MHPQPLEHVFLAGPSKAETSNCPDLEAGFSFKLQIFQSKIKNQTSFPNKLIWMADEKYQVRYFDYWFCLYECKLELIIPIYSIPLDKMLFVEEIIKVIYS
jgi:hypothetical protein